jgi:hypothetical protein
MKGCLRGVKVKTDKMSKVYIHINGNPFDPTVEIPKVPKEFVKNVTLRETINKGLLKDGIYCLDDAKVLIKTCYEKNDGCYEEVNTYQHIRASAPSLEVLKYVYNRLRKGELEPSKDWRKSTKPVRN